MKHEICSNRRAYSLLQTQEVVSLFLFPDHWVLLFQTCGSVSRAPEGWGRAAYHSTLSTWGKGMWVKAIQRLSANRRFVTCNPETCDVREEKGTVWGCDCTRVVCVCDYLSTEDNVSGLAGLIHTRTIYEYCLGFLCSHVNCTATACFTKLTWNSTWLLIEFKTIHLKMKNLSSFPRSGQHFPKAS